MSELSNYQAVVDRLTPEEAEMVRRTILLLKKYKAAHELLGKDFTDLHRMVFSNHKLRMNLRASLLLQEKSIRDEFKPHLWLLVPFLG